MNDHSYLHSNPAISRRAALFGIASGGLALTLPKVFSAETGRAREFIFFSKPFQSLSFDELGRRAADIGYTGLEFPVRPGGHIQPEAVEDELPQAVETFQKHDLSVPLITTGINQVSKGQYTEKVLRTAAKLGITHFRMAYYKYDFDKPIVDQLKSIEPQIDDLIALSSELGIKPVYQNHSGGNLVGAPLWDIYALIRKHDPSRIGLAYDIGHALVEATQSWRIQFELIRDYIAIPYIKEPAWDTDRNRFEWTPLGTGIIPREYYRLLSDAGINGPFSVHVEYLDIGNPANQPRLWDAFEKDLSTLKKLTQ
jgi:sugar phosphate isomerase/epimerase